MDEYLEGIMNRDKPECKLVTQSKSEDNLRVFLDQAGRGCISGQICEWPQLKPACKYAIETIEKIETELHQTKLALESVNKDCDILEKQLKMANEMLDWLDKCYDWQLRPNPTTFICKESEKSLREAITTAMKKGE